MKKKVILSGIQPTGNLHIGNYLGAIKNWVEFSEKEQDNDCLFCIVDLHAITVKQDPQELKNSILETYATYIACGIDPVKNTIFVQSQIAAHAELSWILSCMTPMGWLNRMTQFKEKSDKHKDKASLGLYAYPVLMAADILLYQSDLVPVGDDQKQHLELSRDIAEKFNQDFAPVFNVPEPIIKGEATRIMSLKDGNNKMSKSDISDLSRINLTDSADLIIKKIKKAKTDNYDNLTDDIENRPEAKNLLKIYASFADINFNQAIIQIGNLSFAKFKAELADIIVDKLKPIQTSQKKLMNDKSYLLKLIQSGKENARVRAEKTLNKVKETIGFLVNT